jgi:hypothetical protein
VDVQATRKAIVQWTIVRDDALDPEMRREARYMVEMLQAELDNFARKLLQQEPINQVYYDTEKGDEEC